MERPYTGLTEIKSGEVAEDLAAYLADSEQTNSALALGVSIARDTSVRAAGGYLLQVSGCNRNTVHCALIRQEHCSNEEEEKHSVGMLSVSTDALRRNPSRGFLIRYPTDTLMILNP